LSIRQRLSIKNTLIIHLQENKRVLSASWCKDSD